MQAKRRVPKQPRGRGVVNRKKASARGAAATTNAAAIYVAADWVHNEHKQMQA